jgi:hypothetical protein
MEQKRFYRASVTSCNATIGQADDVLALHQPLNLIISPSIRDLVSLQCGSKITTPVHGTNNGIYTRATPQQIMRRI